MGLPGDALLATLHAPKHGARFYDQFHGIRGRNASCHHIMRVPSHRQRDNKSSITSTCRCSQLVSLSSCVSVVLCQVVCQCLPELLAPLSLLMEQTRQATVDTTIFEVSKLARKATVWANTPLNIQLRMTRRANCK